MKKLLWLTLVCGATLTGCARHYNMTLSNGQTVTARGKPKLDKATGTFRFTNAQGQPQVLPSFRVRTIEPR